jgi:5'-3' exonuclease
MGIPFYFGEIIAKSPVSKRYNIVADALKKPCSRFFLDFNSIIHPCSAQVVARLGKAQEVNDQLYRTIFDNIADYTIKLIDIAQPTELVYIAIDGVAPRAKMHQQRKRRFLSAQRNIAISGFKAKHNIPDTKWDSNAITPGTDFMKKLDTYLTTHFNDVIKTKYPSLQQFIVSGSSEAGEGEHKMMHYIKKHNQHNQHNQHSQDMGACDIVYGLDADLIMLSLMSEGSDIVLMRESQDFGKMQSANKVPFKYLDINNLREGILETMDKDNDQATNPLSLVNDYVFMCYLLGNDFIPSLSFLKIKEGAVDVLIDCYREAMSQLPERHNIVIVGSSSSNSNSISSKCSINFDAFVAFMTAIKSKEDELMQIAMDHYNNAVPRPFKNFNTILHNIKTYNPQLTHKEVQERAVREFSMDLEEYPLRNKFMVEIEPTKDKKWRNTYYHYIFGSNSMETIRQACSKYVEGMLWTTNYYFDQSASQEWYYHHHYAPSASDLVKYLMSQTQETLDTRKNDLQSVSIDESSASSASSASIQSSQLLQLLLVLPPQSKALLPQHLQCIMTDISYGCLHYYPKDFKVMTFLKNKMWECTPLVPNIDVELIKEALQTSET